MVGRGDVMSAPVNHNDNKNADDPSFYAPRGARRLAQMSAQASAQTSAQAPPSPAVAPSAPQPGEAASFSAVEAADPGGERPDQPWPPLPAPFDPVPIMPEPHHASAPGRIAPA